MKQSDKAESKLKDSKPLSKREEEGLKSNYTVAKKIHQKYQRNLAAPNIQILSKQTEINKTTNT